MNTKIIGMVILILNVCSIKAQDLIDPARLPLETLQNLPDGWNNTIFTRNSNESNFILGWNWGSDGDRLSEALNINTSHGLFFSDSNNHEIDNMNVIVRMDKAWLYNPIALGNRHNSLFNAQAMMLNPAMTVDTNESNFNPEPDPKNTGAIYGWREKCSDSRIASNDENTHLYTLHRNVQGINYQNGIIVLKNVWDGSILHWLDYLGGTSIDELSKENLDKDKNAFHPFNGKQWYITINLETLSSLTGHDNDVILEIRLPYILDNLQADTLKLDSLPNPTASQEIIDPFGTHRGWYRQLIKDATQLKVFQITGKMLRQNSTITISAFAFLTGKENKKTHKLIDNPRLKNDNWENPYNITDPMITNLDIEVKYYGKVDIAINWVRIETPRAREIFFGQHDDEVLEAVGAEITGMQADPTHPKIFRFYGNDEITPAYYAAMRYYNMLLDTMAALETGAMNTNKFLYATGFKEFWNGNNIHFNGEIAVPYIKYGYYDKNSPITFRKYLNYKLGYKGTRRIGWYPYFNSDLTFNDTLNSQYETVLIKRPGDGNGRYTFWDFTRPQEDYPEVFYRHWIDGVSDEQNSYQIYEGGVQFAIEKELHNWYYENTAMLFNNKPWWANQWVVPGRWYQESSMNNTFCTNQNIRPKTGEELRLMIDIPLLLGCKGLLYWQKETEGNFLLQEPAGTQSDGCVGLQPNPNLHFNIEDNTYDYIYGNLTGENLIYSDYKMDNTLHHKVGLGGDYILGLDADTSTHDPNGFDRHFHANQYAFNTANDKDMGMGINQNQIYIGLKSNRAEIYKIHKWIKANESTLINLRLEAWYAKGFTKWYAQDPQYLDSNVLDNYIDKKNILTRPVERVNTLGAPLYEQSSSLDSGFYDITMLRNVDSISANVKYLGIQNRRTDPLILNENNKLEFIPTAEFDSLVRFGGKGYDSTYWQSKWWQRLGSREISIPFYYQLINPTLYNGDYVIARELGAEDTTLRNHNFWLSNKYHSWIDTTIRRDGILKGKFLPGEGKLIKLEFRNLAEGNPKDTCTGCEWIVKHINVKKSEMTSNNGYFEWDVDIENTSNCDYSTLNLLLIFDNTITDSIQFSNWIPMDSTNIAAHFKNQLKSNSTKKIHIKSKSSEVFSFKVWVGTIINGEIIKCDQILSDNFSGYSVDYTQI